jgi:hypothetical protein
MGQGSDQLQVKIIYHAGARVEVSLAKRFARGVDRFAERAIEIPPVAAGLHLGRVVEAHLRRPHAGKALRAQMYALFLHGKTLPRRSRFRGGGRDSHQIRGHGPGDAAPYRASHLRQQLDGRSFHRSPRIRQRHHAFARRHRENRRAPVGGVLKEARQRGGDASRRGVGDHRLAALHGRRQRRRLHQRNLQAPEISRRLRGAADLFTLGGLAIQSEQRRAGSESGGGVHQSGRNFLRVGRLTHAPHRLVQLVRRLAPGAGVRKALRVAQELVNAVVEKLAQTHRRSAGSHS